MRCHRALPTLICLATLCPPLLAGEWQVRSEPLVTREMSPKQPQQLKQPAVLEVGENGGPAKLWYAGYWGAQNMYLSELPDTKSEPGPDWAPQSKVCVFRETGSEMLVSSPSVVKDGPGYRMWYTYSPNWDTPWKIGTANSVDGLTWEASRLNPALETETGDGVGSADDVCVVQADGTWHMWYAAKHPNHWKVEIFHATSADAIDWQLSGAVQFDVFYPGLIMDPSVLVIDGTLHMFYVTLDSESPPTLRHATSADGQTWKTSLLPSLENVRGPAALVTPDGWKVYFTRDELIWSATIERQGGQPPDGGEKF